MKTQIIIDGQTAGNIILKNAIECNNLHDIVISENFGYKIYFDRKGDAVKAISKAWHRLRLEEPKYMGIKYFKGRKLMYDASKAFIAIS